MHTANVLLRPLCRLVDEHVLQEKVVYIALYYCCLAGALLYIQLQLKPGNHADMQQRLAATLMHAP